MVAWLTILDNRVHKENARIFPVHTIFLLLLTVNVLYVSAWVCVYVYYRGRRRRVVGIYDEALWDFTSDDDDHST